jgi:hypothetical protein
MTNRYERNRSARPSLDTVTRRRPHADAILDRREHMLTTPDSIIREYNQLGLEDPGHAQGLKL